MGQVHAAGELPPEGELEAQEYAVKRVNVGATAAPKEERVVDMRSDTVTKPTVQMRAAMAFADVGDDVLGDDHSVACLEAETAKVFGKEAGLYVPSGTMANLIAIMVHCETRGSEIILGDKSHIHIYEQGGCATVAGVHPRALPNQPDGTLDLQAIAGSVRPADDHFPVSRLLCLENTHNKCGGRVLPVSYMDNAAEVAHRHGMKVHLDGARVMNAAMALEISPARLVQSMDSVSVCLSKALGAPVGSVLLGPADFIAKARRNRKLLGGGMRQVGPLAAAGLCALRHGPSRLLLDHSHARRVAEALSTVRGVTMDLASVQSNIVMVGTGERKAEVLASELKAKGLLVIAVGPHQLRLVFHHQVTAEDVELAIPVLTEVLVD